MKNVKRRLEILSFYDSTGITAHLERMARKGWALESIRKSLWRYRRIEPKELHYAVVYLPSSSEFDPGPTEDNQALQEFCARAGWVQVASAAQMHIFCSEAEDPVPIETEPMVQLENIHRAMKKNFLPSQIAMLVLGVIQLLLSVWQYSISPLDFLAGSSNFVSILCWLLIALMSVYDIAQYSLWRWRALAAAEDGRFLPTRGTQWIQYLCLILLAATFLPWILSMTDGMQRFIVFFSLAAMAVLFVTVFAVKAIFQRRGAQTGTTRAAVWITSIFMAIAYMMCLIWVITAGIDGNWFREDTETYEYMGMTWEVHHEELPLTIEELMQTDYNSYSTELSVNASPFLTATEAHQRPRMDALKEPDLDYAIYDARFGFVTRFVLDQLMDISEPTDEVPEEYRLFGQTENGTTVYQLYRDGLAWDSLVLHKGNRVVLLRPGWGMSREQTEIAAAILMP